MLHGHGDEITGRGSTSIVSRRYRGGGRASPQAPADLVAHVGQQPATVLYRPRILIRGHDPGDLHRAHFGPTADAGGNNVVLSTTTGQGRRRRLGNPRQVNRIAATWREGLLLFLLPCT